MCNICITAVDSSTLIGSIPWGDHHHAKQIEAQLHKMEWVEDVLPVETNIVVCMLKDHQRVQEFVSKFESKGILIMAFGKGMLRMVTHLDISETDTAELCAAIGVMR